MDRQFSIAKCEDTGNLAFYQHTEISGVPTKVLLFHECDFWEAYAILARQFLTEQQHANG
jgi:hypothetical protein